ncbi:hypothetical protein [Terriglobus roseus]|uniref:Phage protein D n=1 Tax=Terriglobus roseus TaxID=392734 RepID=A0A1H4IXH0_9BACT|nr:hypothetical protein [Terriglobus roseus]SEB38780.1 hypothetical protein SAMN05443244_0181 [Terriglobus roseus]
MANGLYLTLLAGPVIAVPVPKPVTDALTSVEITNSSDRSGFQLTFTLANNSILQTLFLLAAGGPIPMLRVILMVTFGGIPQVVMDGVIQHHEIAPDAMHGSSKLVLTGQDLSAVMDLVKMNGVPYPGMTPDLRVLTILAKYAVFGIVPMVIPVPAPDVEVPVEKIPTQEGTDLAYIRKLAEEVGYVFYVEPGLLPGTSTAYWGPSVRIGIPQPALNANMDSWTNVESLNFRYQTQESVMPLAYIQDPLTKAIIPVPIPAVTPFSPPLGLVIPVPQKIEPLDDVSNKPVAQTLMRLWAKAVETSDVVTGDGTLDVQRYGWILRARSLVGVRGAGLAFDGLHYVESTTHTIQPGQYKQSFTLKRNALISNIPLVPALPY